MPGFFMWASQNHLFNICNSYTLVYLVHTMTRLDFDD